MNERKSLMISKFFYAQLNKPLKGDWILSVLDDLKNVELDCYTFDELENLTKKQFKNIVNESVKTNAFDYLIDLKEKYSKIKHIKYSQLQLQAYLTTNNLSIQESKFLF